MIHKITSITVPFTPETIFLNSSPKDLSSRQHRTAIDVMLDAAKTAIASYWKDSKPPSTEVWFKKLWSHYLMDLVTQYK